MPNSLLTKSSASCALVSICTLCSTGLDTCRHRSGCGRASVIGSCRLDDGYQCFRPVFVETSSSGRDAPHGMRAKAPVPDLRQLLHPLSGNHPNDCFSTTLWWSDEDAADWGPGPPSEPADPPMRGTGSFSDITDCQRSPAYHAVTESSLAVRR
jgi:hypothetical protein